MDTRSEVLVSPVVEQQTLKAPWVQASNRKLWVSIFAGQAVLLALMVYSALLIARRLDIQQSALNAQHLQAGELKDALAALTSQTETMKQEVLNLRQTVSSNTGEDVLFLKVLLLKPEVDVVLARTIAGHTHRHAQLYGRDPNLVLAIMAVESDFNPKAISSVGATGLMQVMPHWKKVLAITGDLTDPDTNIQYGLQILGFYVEMYGDLEMALTAYNRGPGPVDFALRKGTEPRNGYGAKVLVTYERLKQLNVQ